MPSSPSKDNKFALLRTPGRYAHALGVTVNSLSFTNVGPGRKLTSDVSSGATRVVLDNVAGITPAAHLQIGAAATARFTKSPRWDRIRAP